MFRVQGRIGQYELVKLLAASHGTAGMVCLAVDTQTRRRVALKTISHAGGDNVEALIEAERKGAVLQERLARRSDGVPAIYDCGDADGVFYIAMEYVEGEDLDKTIGNGARLAPEAAAWIAADVCACLAAAHAPHHLVDGVRRAIIHGDVKPSNIRITPSGRAKLLDFGTAAPVVPAHAAAYSSYLTLAYASPERLDTGIIDAHTDLWAAGIVLYEAIAGRRPWERSDVRGDCRERPSPSCSYPPALPSSCPAALARIAGKALASELSNRYESADAMLVALDEFLFASARAQFSPLHTICG